MSKTHEQFKCELELQEDFLIRTLMVNKIFPSKSHPILIISYIFIFINIFLLFINFCFIFTKLIFTFVNILTRARFVLKE